MLPLTRGHHPRQPEQYSVSGEPHLSALLLTSFGRPVNAHVKKINIDLASSPGLISTFFCAIFGKIFQK